MNIKETLAARKSTHGEYSDHARVTQQIMEILMREKNWSLLMHIQRESLHMFAHKMGRIMVGNPNEPDHWRDIAGYATLVEERLPKAPPKAQSTGPGTPEDGGHHARFTEENGH
jgi:hypothetical protein